MEGVEPLPVASMRRRHVEWMDTLMGVLRTPEGEVLFWVLAAVGIGGLYYGWLVYHAFVG